MKLAMSFATAVLAGCAAHPEPIVDLRGVDPVRYESDLAECQAYADQIKTTAGATRGAVAGAAYGAAIGAIREDIGRSAGVGAVSGGAWSAVKADRDRQQLVKRCLRGRGYRVLN